MTRYLRGRTAFFDRAVVNSFGRGVRQFVAVGAGYDGRALRYDKEGTHWWEVDQPGTQEDKRARLARLGIEAANITFVSHDLRDGNLAKALLDHGFDPDAPATILCEGVAVYLEPAVLADVLTDLRLLATAGTRLAVSLSVERPALDDEGPNPRTERFRAAVAAMGEPALSSFGADDLGPFLARARWWPAEVPERAQRAGFVVALPLWSQPTAGTGGQTISATGRFIEQMLYRAAPEALPAHIEATYGVRVERARELDLGVHRVDLASGTTWVARVSPVCRPPEAAESDARLLHWLCGAGIPAERPAQPQPVSVQEGQPVLVTEFVPGPKAAAGEETFRYLGDLMGRLHLLPTSASPAMRPGGAWHHLALDCGLGEEKAAALSLFGHARPRVSPGEEALYDRLAADLAGSPTFEELPYAFGHPDLVPSNVVGSRDGCGVIVDWAGAGLAPRIASLGALLWAAALSSTRKAANFANALGAYRSVVKLEPGEVAQLGAAMRARPLILACWAFATGRRELSDVAKQWDAQRAAIDRAVQAL